MKNNIIKNIFISFLILIQRTNLQHRHGRIFNGMNRRSKGLLSIPIILSQSMNTQKVKKRYLESVFMEAQAITNLAESFGHNDSFKVLDIGCGIAGYHRDWLKSRSNSNDHLYLLDSNNFHLSALAYGHGDSKRYYNSLNLAKYFIMQDNDFTTNIKLLDIAKSHDFPLQIDLVVSFISWGFHYPLSLYWERVLASTKLGGCIIVDIRKDSESERFLLLRTGIKSKIVYENAKFNRVLITKVAM